MSERSRDARRGCGLLLLSVPLCGLLGLGAGALGIGLVTLLLTLVGCAAPPITVGAIAYPPDGSRVAAGPGWVRVYAYRRGWATLQFESGWIYSQELPREVRLQVDGETVFRWRQGDEGWFPSDPVPLPVRLAPGEHTLRVEVRAGGRTAVDQVRVTAVEAGPWRLASVPVEDGAPAPRLFVDGQGILWWVGPEEAASGQVEVGGIEPDPGGGQLEGPLIPLLGGRAQLLDLNGGGSYLLQLRGPLPPTAAWGSLFPGPSRTLVWRSPLALRRWQGDRWVREGTFPIWSPPDGRLLPVSGREAWALGRGGGARWVDGAWQPLPLPDAEARILRPGVAWAPGRFFLWRDGVWTAVGPLPEELRQPHVLDFSALGEEGTVLTCGGDLWLVRGRWLWDATPEARGRLRIYRWDGEGWTWQDLRVRRDDGDWVWGTLACVGGRPWLAVANGQERAGARRSAFARGLLAFGLGPEADRELGYGGVWRWTDGDRWEPAIQPPLWGNYGGDRLPGEGLGVQARPPGEGRIWIAVARP